jgi:hypothetical protein
VARHSYETQPALITQVPKGQCITVNFEPEIWHEKDALTYYLLVISVAKSYQYWTSSTIPITVCP